MKRLLCLLGWVFLGAVFSASAGGKETVIFSGKKQFLDKWLATGWAGIETKVIDGAGPEKGAAVSSIFTTETAPWSGMALQLGFEQNALEGCIPLDEKLKTKGIVQLTLNCGKTKEGKEGGDQELQLGVIFVLKSGERAPVAPVPMSQLGKIGKLDGNSKTWEEVEFSIADMLKKLPDPSQAVGIWSVNIQYVDTPVCEILVGDCVIKDK